MEEWRVKDDERADRAVTFAMAPMSYTATAKAKQLAFAADTALRSFFRYSSPLHRLACDKTAPVRKHHIVTAVLLVYYCCCLQTKFKAHNKRATVSSEVNLFEALKPQPFI